MISAAIGAGGAYSTARAERIGTRRQSPDPGGGRNETFLPGSRRDAAHASGVSRRRAGRTGGMNPRMHRPP